MNTKPDSPPDMAAKVEVKTTFEPARTIEPIYTGGDVSLDSSGRVLASCVEEDVLLVDLITGRTLARIEGDGEPITSLVLSQSATFLAICSRSLSMRLYRLQQESDDENIQPVLLRTLKPHNSPVVTSAIDDSETLLATGCADGTVKVWDLNGGFATHTFHGHGGVISALKFFQIESNASSTDGLLSRKRSQDGKPKHSPGSGPDAAKSGQTFFLASGSEDGKIRIWDLQKRKPTALLDSLVSVVRALDYSWEENTLLSSSRDKTIILWDCKTWKTRKVVPVLELVEAAGFLANGSICYSGGEHGRLRLWETSTGREITEEQEAGGENDTIVSLQNPRKAEYILSVHLDQTLRLFSTAGLSGKQSMQRIEALPIIHRLSGNHDEVIDLVRLGEDRNLLALATNTENVRIISLGLDTTKHSDSASLESQSFGADVALLEGHSDIIICLDVDWSGHWLATGAKDNTARLWRIDPATASFDCVAVFSGHAESLGAIALPRTPPSSNPPALQDPLNHPPAFLLTGSQDRTVKRWDTSKIILPSNSSEPQSGIRALFTRVAHEKDINALDTSPVTPIFASASQDRTIKIWSIEDGSVTGILRGHKRGVWSIRFAPKDTPLIQTGDGSSSGSRGILVSGSGDRTVKVWSLTTYSCLLTFEGHSNSVLKVVWLYPPVHSSEDENENPSSRISSSHNQNPLIASASSDSLIKIWTPYNSSSSPTTSSDLDSAGLLATLDNHTDRVWALFSYPPSFPSSSSSTKRITPNPYPLISGSADATITCWTDTTSTTTLALTRRAEQLVEQDQALQNHIQAKNYREVIVLCLQLNHPGRLLKVFQDVMSSGKPNHDQDSEEEEEAITGSKEVDQVLASLSSSQIILLLQRIRDWNTNARTAPVAQTILHCLLKNYPVSYFLDISKSLRKRNYMRRTGDREDDEEAGDDDDDEEQQQQGERSIKGVDMKELFRALEVYTERHYKRIEELEDEMYVVEYTLGEMDEILGGGLPALEDGDASMEEGKRVRDLDVLMT